MISGELFGTHDYFAFLGAAILLNLVPGQDTLYIIGRSLAQGRKAGIVSVLGIGSGCLIHITAAALGLYAVLTICPPAFLAITLLGGVYLIWLGISTWIYRNSGGLGIWAGDVAGTGPAAVSPSTDLFVVYRQGLLTNLLNVKVALFFIAFLPAFIDPAAGYGAISFLFLGLSFLMTGTIWCMVVALGASAFADALRNRPKMQMGFDLVAGSLFIILGTGILLFHV